MENIKWPLDGIEPREVQLAALRKGYGRSGFAYFLRQRLGKTWLAFAEYTLLREENKVDWMVVICPNSIKRQWYEAVEEANEYIPVHIYSSQTKDRTRYWFEKNTVGGVFIINYESVKSFYDDGGWSKFNPLRTYLVADESTKMADSEARMTRAALDMAALCQYTRVLTGKPSKGSNADLWTQLKFINATQRTYLQHKYAFTLVGGFQGRQVLKNLNTELLQREMEPHCFIAGDKYTDGFRKVYEPPRKVEMLGQQLAIYRQMEKDFLVELFGGDKKMTATIVLVKYLRLEQISSGIGGDDGEHFNIIEPQDNPKIKAVKEILDSEAGYKTIIVCRFRLSIENLKNELERDGHKVAIMHGGMGAELDVQKKLFHEGDHDILVAQLQVLNFGHTLCGPDDRPCTDMIFYERDYSLINSAQCESRPEKLGRNEPISIWDFYASQMNREIIRALIKKEDASQALMGYARNKGILYHKKENDDELSE